MDDEFEGLRAKLASVAGTPLDDPEVVRVLAEAVNGGGGVHIELDEATRYRLIRRDGKFQLTKESRTRSSTLPPRR